VTIYLIRHGETHWNRKHRLQGIRDLPPNRAGLRQAGRLCERLRRWTIRSIYTSPLLRARRTALEIGSSQQCPIIVQDDLGEIDHRSWTGMTITEITKQHSEEHSDWESSPERFRPRTGETLPMVYRRSTRVFDRLLAPDTSETVVMVSHGVVNAPLLCSVFGLPTARVWDFPQANGSVYVLRSKGREISSVECLVHG
jgi:broad specificity phosphatase PhoE